jgi:hypothetical protein
MYVVKVSVDPNHLNASIGKYEHRHHDHDADTDDDEGNDRD